MVVTQIAVILVCSWEKATWGSFYSIILVTPRKMWMTESSTCIKFLLHLLIPPSSYHVSVCVCVCVHVNNNLDQRKDSLEKIDSESKELGAILLGHLRFYTVTKWTWLWHWPSWLPKQKKEISHTILSVHTHAHTHTIRSSGQAKLPQALSPEGNCSCRGTD